MKIYFIFFFIVNLFVRSELLAQSIYLKMDTVTGSSNYPGFTGWSQILSYSHQIETPNVPRQGGPLSSSAFNNRPGMVSVSMTQDIISPYLLEASATGLPIKSMAITYVRGSDNNRLEIRLKLKNVVVQAFNTDIRHNFQSINNVVFTYTAFSYEYILPRVTGVTTRIQSEDFNEIDFRKN